MHNNDMSDRSATTTEQRGGLPLSREVGSEGRIGRRQHGPSDPEATPSDDEDQTIVEGGRIRDAAAGAVGDDDQHQRSRDLHTPHSPPVTQRQQSTVGTAPAVQLRSVVTRPVQPRLTGARGRATSGNGVLRLCRPGREGDNSTSGAQRGASAVQDVLRNSPVQTTSASRDTPRSRNSSFSLQISDVDDDARQPDYPMSISPNRHYSSVRTGSRDYVRLHDNPSPTSARPRRLPSPPHQRCEFADVHPRESERRVNEDDYIRSVSPGFDGYGGRYTEPTVRVRQDQTTHRDGHRHVDRNLVPYYVSRGQGSPAPELKETTWRGEKDHHSGWHRRNSSSRSSCSSCSGAGDYCSSDEFRTSRFRSKERSRERRVTTSPDPLMRRHSTRDHLDEKAESVQRTTDEQAFFKYALAKFDALETKLLRHQLRLRSLTADVGQLEAVCSVLVEQLNARERPRGRCYRCGVRGHHRQECDQPRRPRRRSTFRGVDQLQDQEHPDRSNGVGIEDDVFGHPIIGGPADGITTTGTPPSERTRVSAAGQQSRRRTTSRTRHRASRQKADNLLEQRNKFPKAFELTTNSPLRRRPVDNVMGTEMMRTNGPRLDAAGGQTTTHGRQTSTPHLFNRAVTSQRTANVYRQPVSTLPAPTINRPHTSIGGPADGSNEFCSSGSRPRR